MVGENIIMMSLKEARRMNTIHQAIDKVITQKKAGEIIGISPILTKRLVARVREEGPEGIIHKSRGKPSTRGIDDELRAKMMQLYQ